MTREHRKHAFTRLLSTDDRGRRLYGCAHKGCVEVMLSEPPKRDDSSQPEAPSIDLWGER